MCAYGSLEVVQAKRWSVARRIVGRGLKARGVFVPAHILYLGCCICWACERPPLPPNPTSFAWALCAKRGRKICDVCSKDLLGRIQRSFENASGFLVFAIHHFFLSFLYHAVVGSLEVEKAKKKILAESPKKYRCRLGKLITSCNTAHDFQNKNNNSVRILVWKPVTLSNPLIID